MGWWNKEVEPVKTLAWRLVSIEVKGPSDRRPSGVVNLRATMAIMWKACLNEQTWLAESDGQ
jgi:hypothetical protein